ncbi:MAG: hypothetical protein GY862_04220 [Gammaproteobacteria bacterium]|nr:hypothetical protein [Gammaproteobacteria bacterium]
MKKIVISILTLMLFAACGQTSEQTDGPPVSESEQNASGQHQSAPVGNQNPEDISLSAERKATRHGRNILSTGRQMTLVNREIIRGGCWDYANAVYNRAGYPSRSGKRRVIFKSTKRGPYADVRLIQPGDFLYYINYSYGNIEHSAIFVDWLDYNNKEALMLSYGGERRRDPARYLPYDLSGVYRIIRAN